MEQTDLWRASHRLTAVAGHFGSGKTEFAVNLALSLAADGLPATLADLDVVDPYFRSRERADLLEQAGVHLPGLYGRRRALPPPGGHVPL